MCVNVYLRAYTIRKVAYRKWLIKQNKITLSERSRVWKLWGVFFFFFGGLRFAFFPLIALYRHGWIKFLVDCLNSIDVNKLNLKTCPNQNGVAVRFQYHNGRCTCGTELYFHSGRVHIAEEPRIKKKQKNQHRLHFIVNFIYHFRNIVLERIFGCRSFGFFSDLYSSLLPPSRIMDCSKCNTWGIRQCFR